MAPQCISRSCWCSPRPLSGHQAEVSWAEPAAEGHHDVGQPAHDGGSHSSRSGTVEGTAAPTPAWSVPRACYCRGLYPVAVPCCCNCKSAISVGEAWWSGPLGLPQCLRLQTAPLHCTSAHRQLLYTVSRSVCDSSTSSLARQRQTL